MSSLSRILPTARRLLPVASAAALLITMGVGCGSYVNIRYPKFPDGEVGSRLRSTLDNKKRVGVIARAIPAGMMNTLRREGLATEWSETMLATMRTALEDYGYYTLVDVESRKQRYDELANSQTGMTSMQLAIGQELQVDHLFFVNMTAIPRVECKIENVVDKFAAAAAAADAIMAARNRRPGGSTQPVSKPTGVLYLTVFLEGKLVNIETGRSSSFSTSDPLRAENQPGNTDCPSQLGAFSSALKMAAKKIADRLSPRVMERRVVLEDSVDEIKSGDKKVIEGYLKDGMKWIDAEDMGEAEKSWQQALDESGGSSASALWNIGIVKFANGNMDEAGKYFERAMSTGGKKWVNSDKRELYAIFKKEKKRMEEEK